MVKVLSPLSRVEKIKSFVWSPEFGTVIITMLLLFAIPATIFMFSKPQDIRQRASSLSRTATINMVPSIAVYKLNEIFSVNLVIDGGGQAFDSAQAIVKVTNNLEVLSLNMMSPNTGGCNFTFSNSDATPTLQNLSFNGMLPNNYSSKCTLYTLTLKGINTGVGKVDISNASVKSFSPADEEILLSTQTGYYTIPIQSR